MKRLWLIMMAGLFAGMVQAAVTVTNLVVVQVPGTKTVQITYDVSSAETNAVTVSLLVSNGTQAVSCPSVSGDVGEDVAIGTGKAIVWTGGVDWNGNAATLSATVSADDGIPQVPEGGDPSAITWEVVNDRWVRNIYTDGSITMNDRDTGVMWIYDADTSGTMNWDNAITYCANLIYAGYDDWTLRNVWRDDLVSQGDVFKDVRSGWYWMNVSLDPGQADVFSFSDQRCYSEPKSSLVWVLPCRYPISQEPLHLGDAGTTFFLDTRDYTLEVVSDHGNPLPGIGRHTYAWQSSVTCSVEEVAQDGWMFTGWSGDVSTDYTQTNVVVVMDELSMSIAANFSDDADGDGLLNTNEFALGSNPRKTDSDGDRMSDGDEVVAGTSLTNASSLLSVNCELQPDGSRLISWFGVGGRYYSFEYTDSLLNSWETYPFELSGSDVPIMLLDTYDGNCSCYRVKVRKP